MAKQKGFQTLGIVIVLLFILVVGITLIPSYHILRSHLKESRIAALRALSDDVRDTVMLTKLRAREDNLKGSGQVELYHNEMIEVNAKHAPAATERGIGMLSAMTAGFDVEYQQTPAYRAVFTYDKEGDCSLIYDLGTDGESLPKIHVVTSGC